MASPRTCRAPNKHGRPCGAPPLREGSRCFWHDPETQEAAAEARRLGGRRRKREGAIKGALDLEGVQTGANLLRVLEVALMDTLEMENSIPRTRALTHVVSVAARVKETAEFEARLRALETGVRREGPEARPQVVAPIVELRYSDERRQMLERDEAQEGPDGDA